MREAREVALVQRARPWEDKDAEQQRGGGPSGDAATEAGAARGKCEGSI